MAIDWSPASQDLGDQSYCQIYCQIRGFEGVAGEKS